MTPRNLLWIPTVVCAVLTGSRAEAVMPAKALLIGNSIYEGKCSPPFPSVPADVAAMTMSLQTAGIPVMAVADRNGIEMSSDIESNIPPGPEDKYAIFYEGLGEVLVDGAWVGPDCTRLHPTNLQGVLGDAIANTLLIMDSCGSGAFADAINALDPRICTITSSTGSDCPTEGAFTPCFTAGLDGAADTNVDGQVTVQEAALYAIANCGDGNTLPTWDGGCPDCVIGVGSVAVAPTTWGRTKASYR